MPESVTDDQGDFFDAFSYFVEESGLSANQIAKIVVERSKECALYYEIGFARSTITGILAGKSRPGSETLYRIAKYGLDLPERTCIYLELLRRQAPPLSRSVWTTQPRLVAVEAPKPLQQQDSPDSGELLPVPSWVLDNPPEGVVKR